MNRKPILVVAIAAALAVLSTMMFGWLASDPPVAAAQPGPPEAREPGLPPQLELEVREEVRTPSAEARARFRVIDELQAPVEGAQLSIANESARWDREKAIAVLGATDAAGRLEVGFSRIEQAPTGSLTVYHDDYSTQPLEPPIARDRENVITLRRGHRLSVRCEDLSGRPIAGAMILASLRALPPVYEIERRRTHPGDAEIQTTHSDEAGRCTIDGLARGRYRIRAIGDGRERIDRHSLASEVPGPELVIRFADIVCGRLRVVGDEVLAYGGRPDAWLSLEMPGRDELRRLRLELMAAHPEDQVFLGLNSDPEGKPAAMDVRVLLRDHGVRHLRVPLMPIREGCSETLLDLADEPVDGIPCVSTRITILSSAGSPVEATDLYLALGPFRDGFQIPIVAGKEKCLPPGKYDLMSHDVYLNESLGQRSVVVSAEDPEHEIQLIGEVMPYRLRLVNDSDEDIPNVFLQITAQGRNQVMSTGIPRTLELWLPSGTVTMKASAVGHQSTDWTGIVGRAPYEPSGVITVVLPRD